ncbi:MAG: hypothetical protein Q4D89_07295 [Arachnia propionica]|uniref:hypothetical protein n=1 Tax=Arachnia propionica TaxID=1750 RepID=UPI0026F5F560|nr:hypothetical protein [Arachnia propionica]
MTTPHPASALPTTPRPRRGLVITTALLALALIVSLAFNVLHITHPTGSSTDRSFASPREAAEFYVTALGEGQVQELIEAQASTTLVEHYDIKADLRRLGHIHIQNPTIPFPLQGEISTELWTQQFRSGATTTVVHQIAVLTATEKVDLDKPTRATVEEALAKFDTTRLKGLRIEQLRVVTDYGPTGQRLLEYAQEAFSPRAITEVFVELSSGHLLILPLVQYDNRWYLSPLAPLAVSISSLPNHRLTPTEEDGFAAIISNLEGEGVVFE